MKNKYIVLAVGATLVLTGLLWPQTAHEAVLAPVEAAEAPQTIVEAVAPKSATSTAALVWWVHRLIMCESRGNVSALNPQDLDGTPSHGLLQFKVSTFALFAKAYKIEGELLDPEAQIAILLRMIDDPSVDLTKQFPACVRKLGLPPQ